MDEMEQQLVICPNCDGKDSSHWPFGPCKICNNSGVTTPEKAEEILKARREYARHHGNP